MQTHGTRGSERRQKQRRVSSPSRGAASEDRASEEEVIMDADGRIAFEGKMDFTFRSCPRAIAAPCSRGRGSADEQRAAGALKTLQADCEAAFVDGGMSFWVGAGQSSRCGLEELALLIFKHHTRHARFDPRKSGAEWWVQVRCDRVGRSLRSKDARISIGMHWDKDEDLVDEQGVNVHPHISTVTYMTGAGAPTLVLQQRCPVEYDAVPEAFGSISEGWLSYPLPGKHMSFDGRFLHGAPASLAPVTSGSDELRITFLANIWLNYHPSGLEMFPASEMASLMTTPQQLRQLSLDLATTDTPVELTGPSSSDPYELELNFGGQTGRDWQAVVPLPHAALSALPPGAAAHIRWPYWKGPASRGDALEDAGEKPRTGIARLQAGPGLWSK